MLTFPPATATVSTQFRMLADQQQQDHTVPHRRLTVPHPSDDELAMLAPAPDFVATHGSGWAPPAVPRSGSASMRPARCTVYLAFSAWTAALGMVLFGFHISELSASQLLLTCASLNLGVGDLPPRTDAVPALPLCIPMSPTLDFGILSAALSVGGLVGSLLSAPIAARYGRRAVFLVSCFFQLLAPALMASAAMYTALLLGRLAAGVGAGLAAAGCAAYLAEIAPDAWRGLFGALSQVSLQIGLLVCSLLNIKFATIDGWRIILASGAVPAVMQLVGVAFMAPSPREVAALKPEMSANGQDPLPVLLRRLWGHDIDDQVIAAGIKRFRPTATHASPIANEDHLVETSDDDDSTDVNTLVGQGSQRSANGKKRPNHGSLRMAGSAARECAAPSPPSARPPASIYEFITSEQYRTSFWLLALAHFSLQACGINVYFSYSHSILTMLFSHSTAVVLFTCSIAYHMVAILICGRLLDRFGRRRMFLAAYAVMGVSAITLHIGDTFNAPIVALIAFFGALTGFALGMGNVPYVLISEVVEPRAIGSAAAVSLTINWFTQGLYLVAFLPLLSLIHSWTFTIIGGITLVTGIVAYHLVPETRGRPGAEVMEELNSRPVKDWPGIRNSIAILVDANGVPMMPHDGGGGNGGIGGGGGSGEISFGAHHVSRAVPVRFTTDLRQPVSSVFVYQQDGGAHARAYVKSPTLDPEPLVDDAMSVHSRSLNQPPSVQDLAKRVRRAQSMRLSQAAFSRSARSMESDTQQRQYGRPLTSWEMLELASEPVEKKASDSADSEDVTSVDGTMGFAALGGASFAATDDALLVADDDAATSADLVSHGDDECTSACEAEDDEPLA
ncbi:major facilitator superfamily domain-containing protein [Blastocladiella britannica]|nr:major facilitator superfamily domain-containing protein [Blastocladiella britannica]